MAEYYQMADIFDEIDEELKQDRAKQVWARYGKYVVSAAAAVVLGVGASQGFTAWKQSQAEASADLYSQAIASDDAVTMLEGSLGDLTDGYALLGRFRIAAGKAGDGDAAAAEGVYLEIAADASVAALYRDAATVLSVMNAPESSNPADLLGVQAGRLETGLEADIALVDPDKPWVIARASMVSAASNTPFDGQPAQGRATALFKGGVKIGADS